MKSILFPKDETVHKKVPSLVKNAVGDVILLTEFTSEKFAYGIVVHPVSFKLGHRNSWSIEHLLPFYGEVRLSSE